jgi:hypothetical protein
MNLEILFASFRVPYLKSVRYYSTLISINTKTSEKYSVPGLDPVSKFLGVFSVFFYSFPFCKF